MEPQPVINYDTERQRAAIARSYTTPPIITLVLYFVLWLPGLIANIVYFQQASGDERLTGHAPEGKGCLLALLLVFTALPIAGGILLFVVIAAASA